MKDLQKQELIRITGGTDLPKGACYANPLKHIAEEGYEDGSWFGKAFGRAAAAFDSAWNKFSQVF